MKNQSTQSQQDINSDLAQDVKVMKKLLILLANKLGVEKKDIAKSMGISAGRLSQILNPKKYK